MNNKSQHDCDEERRRQRWKAGAKNLRLLADRMEKDEIDKGAYWDIQFLLSGDLARIFEQGKISDSKPDEDGGKILTPFQRVTAHPKGALAILRFLRGVIAEDEKEKELAMYEVTDIYEEIFVEPAMMPRFLAEMLHGL